MDERELPCVLDDFPNYHLKQQAEQEKVINDEESRRTAAKKFLSQLEKVLRQKISHQNQRALAVDQALDLYDTVFNKNLCANLFKDSIFITADQIEEFSNEDFDTTVKLLYNENCFRHAFQRLFVQFNLQIAVDSWKNYQMLFQYLSSNKQNVDIPLPASQIWDILDEFIYQFFMCSRWRKSLKSDDLAQIANQDEFWNLVEVNQMLQDFVVLKKDGVQNTLQTFAQYAQLAQVKLLIMQADFTAALNLIGSISHADLLLFSKSGAAYQSLFTYTGFSYLMTGQYRKAVVSFTTIASYFNKYRQLFSKSYQYDHLVKQHEKCLSLLAISLVFYPEYDDTIQALLKESRSRIFEKFEKVQKYDASTLSELFLSSSPKIVSPIASIEEFQNLKEFPVNDLINNQRDRLVREMQEFRLVNDVEQVLKLYKKITKTHFDRLIPIQNIDKYLKRNNVNLNETKFEQTILSIFWHPCRLLQFEVKGEEILVSEQPQDPREFISQVHAMNVQLEKNIQELLKGQ